MTRAELAAPLNRLRDLPADVEREVAALAAEEIGNPHGGWDLGDAAFSPVRDAIAELERVHRLPGGLLARVAA
jgi:hypothetical protein